MNHYKLFNQCFVDKKFLQSKCEVIDVGARNIHTYIHKIPAKRVINLSFSNNCYTDLIRNLDYIGISTTGYLYLASNCCWYRLMVIPDYVKNIVINDNTITITYNGPMRHQYSKQSDIIVDIYMKLQDDDMKIVECILRNIKIY